jgi:hypothetical protein
MKSSGLFPDFEEWQDSYGAFTKNTCSKLPHSTLSGLCRSHAFLPPTLLGAMQIQALRAFPAPQIIN